jgi:NADH-quinone oxidoreductase subunit L
VLDAVWLIPALPLAGFLLLLLAGRRLGEPLAGWLATGAVATSFLLSVAAFISLHGRAVDDRAFDRNLFTWIPAGGLQVKAGLLADPLSMTMVLFVTGIGTLIHLYSIGYMHGDARFPTFFTYLNLFVFSMLVLILADNFLLMFLGWEGVGACSYFLISFWFERDSAASAGKKAFVTNRVGDFGFMLAMFLLFATLGSLQYANVLNPDTAQTLSKGTATAITLLFFVGAAGKSAQLPLYVWLPDAMEGPTPVSALIHAATMVTAGVYLMARLNPILALAPTTLTVIAIVGAVTALFAATIACAQNDIKRVLAYSTISQLGYMFLAVGSGAYIAAIFHMVTHAFFKALLFLGSGSVIHGLHDEQDMKRMGALKKWMPVTAGTFIVGWLAIAGIFPLAGFWSKDDILLNAWFKSPALWAVGALTAVLTAYYMSRQVFLVFYGKPRWDEADAKSEHEALAEPEHEPAATTGHADDGGHGEHGRQPHESPWTMALPLVVLAVLSIFGGGINLPFSSLKVNFLEQWLEPVFAHGALRDVDATSGFKLALLLTVLVACILGILFARTWMNRPENPGLEPDILRRGWGVDALYATIIEAPGRALSAFLAYVFDARVVDGAVNGVAALVRGGGSRLRRVQTGYVRNYALAVAAGVVVVLAFMVSRSQL